jgi:iron complex outermembrane recepter protein
LRSLYYLVLVSLFGLLVAPTASAENSTVGENGRSPLQEVELRKRSQPQNLAQNPQLTRVTGLEVKQTPSGLQVILKTPPGQPKLVPLILPEGNNLLVEILDATLAFNIRNGVTQTNPAPGISQVKVAKIDATSLRVTITGTTQQPPTAAIVSGGQNLVLNVTPKATAQTEADEEIEIVVTGEREEDNYAVPNSNVGTRTDTPIKDVPQSIQVVPQQVLKDQGETDFKDALRNVSGIAQGTNAQFFIRGFKSANSIRRNGSSTNQGGGFQLGNTSLADVEQIEVLKGPAAILFGSGEPGGIVNITTKQPLSQPSYEFQGIIGNFDFYRPSLDVTGPLNEDKTILYRFNSFYENSGSFTDFVENESFGFYPVLSFELGKNTTLTVEGNYREEMSNENSGLSGSDGLPARGTVLPNPVGEIPRSRNLGEPDFNDATFVEWNIGYRLKHQFNDSWSINNSFTANILDQDGQAVRSIGLEADNRTVIRVFNINKDSQENYNLQTDLSGKVQTGIVQHDLLIGVELLRGTSKVFVGRGEAASIDLFEPVYGNLPNLNDAESLFNERVTSDAIGFYAQDLLSIGEKVKILMGGRFDWNFSETEDLFTGETFERDSVNSFSPRVGIVYQPIESVSLYSSYSTFFLPQFELDRLGNPFEPITGRQFEVGVKNEFFDGKASATLAAFQINRRNDFTPDPVDPDNFQVQLGETRSRGIEFDLTGEILQGLKLITTYALTDNQIIEDDNFGTEGNTPANVPLHSGSIWAVYEVPKGEYQGFGVGAGVSAVGERQGADDDTFTIPAYGRVDALLYYRQDKWQAQLNIENLFNKDYIEGSLTDVNVVPGAPFTVRGQLSAEF